MSLVFLKYIFEFFSRASCMLSQYHVYLDMSYCQDQSRETCNKGTAATHKADFENCRWCVQLSIIPPVFRLTVPSSHGVRSLSDSEYNWSVGGYILKGTILVVLPKKVSKIPENMPYWHWAVSSSIVLSLHNRLTGPNLR